MPRPLPRRRVAQVDFTGQWAPLYHEDTIERIPGPELGDYTGLPLNEAGAAARRQLGRRPHLGGPGIPVPAALGRLLAARPCPAARLGRLRRRRRSASSAFHTYIGAYENRRTIYLDGRPHPPDYAAHTFQGFSTGVWNGNMLTITTTHLKANYLRRNGVPRSAKATLTEHWAVHGDYLTIISVVEDPAFLTEPLVRSQTWFLDPGQRAGLFPCEYLPEVPAAAGRRAAPSAGRRIPT